jgi:dTMP kinase
MKLIVIEGLDGAGKSTQITMLSDWFKRNNVSCHYLHFPRTETPYFGELIARFLRGEFGNIDQVDPYLVAMLYAGDRKDASEMISAWLKSGDYVVLDRYTYSNIAYQCAKLKTRDDAMNLRKWILNLEFVHFGIPRPDINIFLDVPFHFTEKKLTTVRQGDDRSYLLGSRDIHESSLEFQSRVRETYLSVAETDDKLQVINCSDSSEGMLPPNEIFKLVIGQLKVRMIL